MYKTQGSNDLSEREELELHDAIRRYTTKLLLMLASSPVVLALIISHASRFLKRELGFGDWVKGIDAAEVTKLENHPVRDYFIRESNTKVSFVSLFRRSTKQSDCLHCVFFDTIHNITKVLYELGCDQKKETTSGGDKLRVLLRVIYHKLLLFSLTNEAIETLLSTAKLEFTAVADGVTAETYGCWDPDVSRRGCDMTTLSSNNDQYNLSSVLSLWAKHKLSRGIRVSVSNLTEYVPRLCDVVTKLKNLKARMVGCHLKLVTSVAKRHCYDDISLNDLVQEGNVGLMKAIDKFDRHKGVKLATYAAWWVRQCIIKHITERTRAMRLPVYFTGNLDELQHKMKVLSRGINLPSSTGYTNRNQLMSWRRTKEPGRTSKRSLAVGHEVTKTHTSVEDTDNLSPPDIVMDLSIRRTVRKALGVLTARETKILRLRFGIGNSNSHTLEEIGKQFGVTRERIRQIETKVLKKLRQPSEFRKLRVLISES